MVRNGGGLSALGRTDRTQAGGGRQERYPAGRCSLSPAHGRDPHTVSLEPPVPLS